MSKSELTDWQKDFIAEFKRSEEIHASREYQLHAYREASMRVRCIHVGEVNSLTRKLMCRECFAEHPCPTLEALQLR